MKKKLLLVVGVVFLLVVAGCTQIIKPADPKVETQRIKLDRESYASYTPAGSDFEQASDLNIKVTNTGTLALSGLKAHIAEAPDEPDSKDLFELVSSSLPTLEPGESGYVTIRFPNTAQGSGIYSAVLLVGSESAAQKVSVKYGEFDFTPDDKILLSEKLLQDTYEGHTRAVIFTTNPAWNEDKPWISGNTSIALVDPESGILSVGGAGTVYIGYVTQEKPLAIMGKKITVYPAPAELNPEYPVDTNNRLARPNNRKAAVINMTDINKAAGTNSLEFTNKNNGGGVIAAVDPDTGELTFGGNNGASASASVTLVIKESVPEGKMLTHRGAANFTAAIGAAPAPVLTKADPVHNDKQTAVTKILLTFNDAVEAAGAVQNGFTVTHAVPDASAFSHTISGASIDNGNTITLTLDSTSEIVYGNEVTVSYSGPNITSNETPLTPFIQPLEHVTYTSTDKLWIKSATVVDTAGNEATDPSNILRVVFNAPIDSIDISKLKVLANLLPGSTSGNPVIPAVRTNTLSNAAVVPDTDESAWDFTMSESAKYGEILRFITEAEGAVVLKSENPAPGTEKLSKVPQFIVRNMVKRTKSGYENTAGLYKNGTFVALTSITDSTVAATAADLYSKAIAWLADSSGIRGGTKLTTSDTTGDVYTIVLGCEQTYTAGASFNNDGCPADYNAVLIITSVDGNDKIINVTGSGDSNALVIRNGLTVVIDKGVIFDGGSTSRSQPLIAINDGGKLILDGGVIRNHVNTVSGAGNAGGGIRMGGGSLGTYLIINSGEISGNTLKSASAITEEMGGAGGVYIYQQGVIVMHDGAIKGNTVDQTGITAGGFRAGAICARGTSNTSYFGNDAFFMTGGTIEGNEVKGSGDTAAAAVFISGAIQKTGGTIYGADAGANANTSTWSNKTTVALTTSSGITGALLKRDATVNPDDRLFREKGGGRNAPDWAENMWDQP